jgi:hypothetical protein
MNSPLISKRDAISILKHILQDLALLLDSKTGVSVSTHTKLEELRSQIQEICNHCEAVYLFEIWHADQLSKNEHSGA